MSPQPVVEQPVSSIQDSSSMHQNAPKCTNAGDRLNCDPVNLNEKQRAAIELIASGKSYTTAAKLLAVDRSTLFRWRQDADFQQRLQQRVSELWGSANDRLKSMVEPSLEVLAEHLEDRYDRARWRAASLVLRLTQFGKARV
jgi:transposase-like protein